MYTVYKITNIITNEYYIGVHKTNNPQDDYLGSGIHIKRQVKKYGRQNFFKEILYIFDNKDDAFSKEKELLSIHLNEKMCINIAKGGEGGPLFEGKCHSEETKQKNRLGTLGRKFIHNDFETKYVKSEELDFYLNTGWKIGKHKKDCNFGRKAWNAGLKLESFTEDHKKRISESLKKYYRSKSKN
jgi:hypothetical protein